jgi:predicted oxidoreductase
MRKIQIGTSGIQASPVALGCMRISGMDNASADALIKAAWDAGIDFYDHADIYGGGKSEEVFARSVARLGLKRDKMILQSKCGIRSGFFDFSREHILTSTDGILKRLATDYLDILLLHRPDTLYEPEEVAGAFETLHKSGKVRHFGVSNQNPGQMELLQSALGQKIVANQLQLSLTNTGMIDQGLNVNMQIDRSVDRDNGVLEYCRLKKITIQAWSPFQYGFFKGTFLGNDEFPELNKVIQKMAQKYHVADTTIAIAWILRHPAQIQAIVGTTNPQRVKQSVQAADITLTRPEWYELYRAAGNTLP